MVLGRLSNRNHWGFFCGSNSIPILPKKTTDEINVVIFRKVVSSRQLVTSLKIRQFEQRDTGVVVQLANDFAFFDGPTTEGDLKITHAFPEGFIVAEEDGKVIGFAYGYFKDVPKEVLHNWGVSRVATIELLVVDPIYRKHGVGTSLVERLTEIFKKAGVDMIGLTCPEGASHAKHLYENQGFEINAYHMRKKLD